MRKHGERRADGARFWGYRKNRMNEGVEVWLSDHVFIRCKERNKKSHQKNLNKNREKVRLWSKKFPDKAAEKRDRRLGRIKNEVLLTDLEKQKVRMIYKICRRITKCLGILHHVDHIVPLYRGGLHHPDNLQILPAKLNCIKGYRIDGDTGRGANLAAYGDATGLVTQSGGDNGGLAIRSLI